MSFDIFVVLGLDVLVNNAGLMHSHKLENITMEVIDEAMDVNVKAALKLTQKCVKHLEASSIKSIVNVSSIAGKSCILFSTLQIREHQKAFEKTFHVLNRTPSLPGCTVVQDHQSRHGSDDPLHGSGSCTQGNPR